MPGFAEHAGRAAGGDNLRPQAAQAASEIEDTGLIGNANQCALNFGHLRAR